MSATLQNPNQSNGHDATGTFTYDGEMEYLYDGDGHICAISSTPVPGTSTLTGHLYDPIRQQGARGLDFETGDSPAMEIHDYDGLRRLCNSSEVSVSRSTGKERDTESGNDYFEARYYGSSMGRFLSPDPLGGHLEDPQSLNKYSYVANNPLIRTDPTGLDFNLQCSGSSATCQNGAQGTTSTDANGKSTFTATVISNDKNGGLVDQNGNKYNATVSGAGVSFSQDGSKQSSIGTFVNGTNATTIQGSGALSGFTFNFTSSDMSAHLNAQGTFTYNGTSDQAIAALQSAGFQHYGMDSFDPFHPNGANYDAYDMRSPGGKGGVGAGHLVVDQPVMRFDIWKVPERTVPTLGTADLGTTNPWTGGFGTHVQEVINHYSQ